MNAFIGLFEALALSAGLLLGFAFLRRIMRSPNPPAIVDNNVAGFAIALFLTLFFMLSLMFLGYTIFALLGSVALSGVLAVVVHVILWCVMRLILPLHEEAVVIGHSIVDADQLPSANLPVH